MKKNRLIVTLLLIIITISIIPPVPVEAAYSVGSSYGDTLQISTTEVKDWSSVIGQLQDSDYPIAYRPNSSGNYYSPIDFTGWAKSAVGPLNAYSRVYALGIQDKSFVITEANAWDTKISTWKIKDLYVLNWLSTLSTSVENAGQTINLNKVKFGYFTYKISKDIDTQSLDDLISMIKSKTFIENNFIDDNNYSVKKSDNIFKEQDPETSTDASVKNIQKLYKNVNKDDLNTLIWYYDTYVNTTIGKKTYGSTKGIRGLAKDSSSTLPSDTDYLGRFIIFSLNGTMLSPKAVAEKAKEEADKDLKDTVISNGGVDDIKSYDDWKIAAAAIHNGYKLSDAIYTEDFLNLNNMKSLTAYQQATILTALQLWNADLPTGIIYSGSISPEEIKNQFSQTKFKQSDTYKENMKEAYTYIESLGGEDDPNYLYRMLSFEARLKYLAGAAQDNTIEIPSVITDFYTKGNSNDFKISPKLATVTIGRNAILGNQFPVKNGQAYIYFVDTVSELYEYSKTVAKTMQDFIDNSTIGEQTQFIQAIQSLYDGLRYIDSDEAWAIWQEPYDSNPLDNAPGTGPSLSSIYNQLQELDAFAGLTTSTELKTGESLQMFFSLKEKKLAPYYLQGVAYSASYIPMSTNVYDAYTIASYDDKFLNNFHYKYGFNRKALYIDTNAKAAVDLYNTKRKGTTRVCTLKDLLSCDKDIVLYLDDNFYNVDKLADLQGKTLDRLDNVDSKTSTKEWYQKLWDAVTDAFNVDIYEQVKTAENTKYSDKLYKKVSKYITKGQPSKDNSKSEADNDDQYVLTSRQIDTYLDGTTKTNDTETNSEITTFDNYNVLQSYSIVSAIYRDKKLYQEANSDVVNSPVFISSPDVACISGSSMGDKQSILNYLLLKNLFSNIPVGYNYNIDMYSPVYMDVYGNILTESGYVVVPAACNSTLYSDKYYSNLYNMGLFSIYGDSYSLPLKFENVDSVMAPAFEADSTTSSWKIKSRMVNGKVADYARLATGDKTVGEAIQKQFSYNLSDSVKMYNMDKFVNIILEVMRGAPIENINKDFEGLNVNHRISKAGLVAAAKLEELQTSLDMKSSNAVLSIPNLAFVDGIEYVVVFLFKVIFFVVLIILMVIVYIDTVGSNLSWRTLTKGLSTIVLTVVVIITVPLVFQITYYQSNRSLLQKETSYIAMLNLEKEQSGVEIGITDVDTPDVSTKLLVKLDDIRVPWYDVFKNVMLSSTFDNLSKVYNEYFDNSPVSNQPDVKVMNDGVYMDVDDLFNSADVEVNLTSKQLYMRTDETLTASFYSPYYVVLQSLLSHINQYNSENNWYAYTTKTQKGGKLKTVGLISAYFNSTDYMESQGDILNFWEVYGMQPNLENSSIFTNGELQKMDSSGWHNANMDNSEKYKRIDKLSDYAREFIADNKNLLGKISDESFLKVMALSIAMKHNQLFGVQKADCYEIYNLSNDDLLRLSLVSRDQVMSNSTLTYPRFVYEVGGTPAVYAAAILSIITWVSGFVCPIATLLIFIAIFVSVFVFKICLRKESSNLYGYVITTLLLCITNLLHSLIIKLSMVLPLFKMPPTVSLLYMCFFEIAYMYVLCFITFTAFKEWRDLGFDKYESKMNTFVQKFKFKDKSNPLTGNSKKSHKAHNNWEFYDKLVDKHKNRAKIRR